MWYWRSNIAKFWFSKPFFYVENLPKLYKKKFHWRIQRWEINFYYYHILITLIFDVLYFLKMHPNFDVRYQIKLNCYAQLFKWGHSKVLYVQVKPTRLLFWVEFRPDLLENVADISSSHKFQTLKLKRYQRKCH
jgi:hypothetical protein